MINSLSKLLFVMTIVVAFVGQTMSYQVAASHNVISNPQFSEQQQVFDNHEGSLKQSESTDDCCETECCESDCICPANVCATIVYIGANTTASEYLFLSEQVPLLVKKDPNFIAASLYRPPILPRRA